MHARGVPRIHRGRVRRLGFSHRIRSADPRVGRRTGPGLLRRPTAAPTATARLLGRRLLGRGRLQVPARPDHLRTTNGCTAGTPVRDGAGDRLVLPGIGPSTARVPLLLWPVERPLPGVVRVGCRADRGLLPPTNLPAPPPTGRRLRGPPAGIGRRPFGLTLVLVRCRVATATVSVPDPRLQRPAGQVGVDRLVLTAIQRTPPAGGAVAPLLVVRIDRNGRRALTPRGGWLALARAAIAASPVPVTHGRSVTLLNRKRNPLSRCSRSLEIVRDDRVTGPTEIFSSTGCEARIRRSTTFGREFPNGFPQAVHTLRTCCPPGSTGCPEARPPAWLSR